MLSITVNTLADENDSYVVNGGSNSLREALAYAATQSGTDLIEFDAKLIGGTIQLAYGQLTVNSPVTIAGLGVDALTIDAQGNSRVIVVTGGVTATISGVTITGGNTVDGGGVYAGGDLTLDSVRIKGNRASSSGGGLYVSDSGHAKLVDTSIENNRAVYGSGIYGYLSAGEHLILERSTVSDNGIAGECFAGGGLYVWSASSGAPSVVTILNSTISGNAASFSGGIRLSGNVQGSVVNSTVAFNRGNEAGGLQYTGATVTVHNSIVAENKNALGTTDSDVWGWGNINSASSNNLFGRGGTGGPSNNDANSNRVLTPTESAGLAPLSDYGGRTKTHALLPTSRAIDGGNNQRAMDKGLTTDQRGFGRAVDDGVVAGPVGGTVDIGAVEFGQRITITGDFDGNGRADYAAYDPLTRTIVAYVGASQGLDRISVGKLDSSKQWERFLVGDFNGDGRDDLWVKELGVDRWSIAVSDGSRFNVSGAAAAITTSSFATPYMGDLDGDGGKEVLGWNGAAGRWDVLKYDDRSGAVIQTSWGNGLGTLQPQQIGDVNADGRDDIIAYDTAGGGSWKVALSLKQANGTDQFVTFTGAAANWTPWIASYGTSNVAARYDSLLEIFNDVYNTIELELYPGLMKGIQATSQAKAGNDWDIAALLVRRLDAVGFQSKIAYGVIDAPVDEVVNWLGVATGEAALRVIKNTLDGGAILISGGAGIRFKHAWVQVNVPTSTGMTTVNLDPSWKFKDWNGSAAIDLTNKPTTYTAITGRANRGTFDEFGFIANTDKKKLPIEWYEDQVMSHLVATGANKSLADAVLAGPIVHRTFDKLPLNTDTLLGSGAVISPVASIETFEDISTILNDDSKKLRFVHSATIRLDQERQVSGQTTSYWRWTIPVSIPQVALSSIYVDYVKSGTTNAYWSRVFVNNEEWVRDSASEPAPFLPSDIAKLTVSHVSPTEFGINAEAVALSHSYKRKPNQILAVGFDANQFTTEHLVGLRAGLNSLMVDGAGVSDIDELLNYTVAKYWLDFNSSNRAVDGLLHTVGGQQWVGSGIVTADAVLVNTPVSHLEFPIVPRNMGVDLPNITHVSFATSTGDISDEAFQLIGYNSSALENAVLEEVVNTESISTMRGLQNAYGVATTDDWVWVYESVWDGSTSTRRIYRRGAIGATSNINKPAYSATAGEITGNVTAGLSVLGAHPSSVVDAISSILTNSGQTNADQYSTIRVLIPNKRSIVDDWTGSVYVAQFNTASGGKSAKYMIDGGTPTSGGYSGNNTKAPNPSTPVATFKNQTFFGDPVSVANGNMFSDELDFRFGNPVIPLDFARHYDSQNQLGIGFGIGWVHSFTGFIYQDQDPTNANDTDYVWLRGNGERHIFEDTNFNVPNSLYGERKVSGSNLTEYLDKDGTKYVFSSGTFDAISGKTVVSRLTAIKNAAGDQGVSISYVGNSVRVAKVESISSPGVNGRYLQFEYNADNTIARVKRYEAGQLAGTWEYVVTTYSELGTTNHRRLTQVRHAGDTANTTNYEYYLDGPEQRKGRIKKITQPNGEFHLYEYYANGRVFRVTDGNGGTVSYSYNLFRNLTEATDERGNVETYFFQDNGLTTKQVHPDRSRLEFTWGAKDSVEEFLMKSSTDEIGAKETFTYYASGESNYQHPGDLKQSVGKDGLVTNYEYWTFPSPYQYISRLKTVTVDPDAATGSQLVTAYTYDGVGNMLSTTNAEGNTTKYEYYTAADGAYRAGLRKSETLPLGVSGDEDVPWEVLTDNFLVTGDSLSVQLMLSTIVGQSVLADAVRIDRVDTNGILTRIVDDNGTGLDPRFRLGSVTPASYSSATAYQGDRLGFTAVDTSGNAAATWVFTGLEKGTYRISATWPGGSFSQAAKYRAFDGLVGAVPHVELSAKNQSSAADDFRSYQTIFQYDAAGNLVAAITEGLPAGHSSYDSRGNVVYQEDATGAATINQYDAQGRLIKTSVVQPKAFNFATLTALSPLYDVQPTLWEARDLGDTLHLYGNTRKAYQLNYSVTANSVLEFDFDAPVSGNYYGLSIHNALNQNEVVGFHLAGTDPNNYGNWKRDFDGYQIGAGQRHYRIPLGQYLAAGTYNYIAFVNANTLGTGAGESYFSNVRVYETASPAEVSATKFTYDASGRVKTSTDALGRTVTNSYDSRGKLICQDFADGTFSKYQYDAVGNRVSTTNELGQTTRYFYDVRNRPIHTVFADGSITSTQYDGAGRVVESTDELGRKTTFKYDRVGRLLQTTQTLEYSGSASETITSTSQYDHLGNLVSVTDPEGNVTTTRHDRLGRVIETRVLKKDATTGKANPSLTPISLTSTGYDANGRAVRRTVFDTASLGALIPTAYVNPAISFESSGLLRFTPNGSSDTLGTPEIRDGGRTLFLEKNSEKAVEVNYKFTANTVLEFDYKDLGPGIAEVYGIGVASTSTNGPIAKAYRLGGSVTSVPSNWLDVANSQVSTSSDGTKHYRISGSQLPPAGVYKYLLFINRDGTPDGSSRFSNVRLYDVDTDPNVAASLASLAGSRPESVQTVQTTYDTFGRPVQATYADGSTTSVIYDAAGRVRYAIDELGRKTENKYDPFGRLERVVLPDPDGAGNQSSAYTRYERDLAGNVVKQWDVFGSSGTTNIEYADTFVYDLRNRLVTTIRKDGTRVDRVFDGVGQLIASVDPLGNSSYTVYDERGRVIEQRQADPDGSGSQFAPVTVNQYDAAGNVVASTDALGNITAFAYDSLNRLRKESRDDTIIVDNSNVADDVEFTADGTSYSSSTLGFNGDYTAIINSQSATWKFANLEAGSYRISISSLMQLLPYGTISFLNQNGQQLASATQFSQPRTARFQTVHGDQAVEWQRVCDSNGNAIQLSMNAGESLWVRLTSNSMFVVADAVRLDRVVSSSYLYDKNGNLTKTTDTRGNVTDYTYDELNRQTKVSLPDPDAFTGNNAGPNGSNLGRLETRTIYDGYGNRIKTIENRGTSSTSDDRTNTYAYDQRNRLTQQVVDEGGGERKNITTSYTYDRAGNRLTVTDPLNSVTRYRYDALNRVIDEYQDYGQGASAAQPLQFGTPSSAAGVSFANNNTSITLTGTAQTWIPLAGSSTSYHVTHRTVLEFDLATLNPALFRVIGIDNDSSFSTAEKNHYFDLGGTLPIQFFFTIEFGQVAPLSGKIQIPIGEYLSDSEKATGLDISRLFFWNQNVGAVGSADAAKSTFSNIKLYESDEVRTVTEYDSRGNVKSVQTKSDPRNIKTEYEYDRLGRQTAKILDSGGSQQRKYTTIYDAAGNVLVERSPWGGTGSAIATTVDTVHQYDRLHRLTKTTLPDPDGPQSPASSPQTLFFYDVAGNLIAETNGKGETVRTAYDAQGRVIAEVDGNGDETRYRYDSEGNLRVVIDAEQNRTVFTYDGLGRQLTESTAVGVNSTPVTRTNVYDNAGNLYRSIDRIGRIREFSYDTLDRRVAEAWKNSSSGTPVNTLTWQYDKLGRITKETDGSIINRYFYDGLGRLTAQMNADPDIAGGGTSQPQVLQTYQYVFSAAASGFARSVDQRSYLLGGAGATVVAQTQSTYDRLGQRAGDLDTDLDPSASTPAIDDKSLGYEYDAAGNLTKITRTTQPGQPASVWNSQFQYDQANRLKSITHDLATDVVHTYAYDNASRITQFNTTGSGATTRGYAYDNAGQLTSQTGSAAESYTYDDNGNRVMANGQSILTVAGNRLKSDGNYDYVYDAEGNLTQRLLAGTSTIVATYAWDHRNRLVTFTDVAANPDLVVTYSYDAQGRRVKRTADPAGAPPPVSEYFVYDGDELSMRFEGATGSASVLTHRYLYGPLTDQVLVDEVFSAGAGGQRVSDEVLWQLADHQGTICDVVDTSGTLRKHVNYDSFGTITGETYYDVNGDWIPATNPAAIDQLFYYTGQEWDKDAKLQNSNARWYDPRMGRFLGEDPTGFDAGDPNFYRYAGNDPVNYTDPTGLSQAGNPLSSLFSGVTKAVTSTANKIAGAVQSIGNSVNSIYNSSQYYAAASPTASSSAILAQANSYFLQQSLNTPLPISVFTAPRRAEPPSFNDVMTTYIASGEARRQVDIGNQRYVEDIVKHGTPGEAFAAQLALGLNGLAENSHPMVGQLNAWGTLLDDKATKTQKAVAVGLGVVDTLLQAMGASGPVRTAVGTNPQTTVVRAFETETRAAREALGQTPLVAPNPLNIVNPHFTPDGTRVLQNLTNQVNERFAANLSLAKTVLSKAELDATIVPGIARMQYGNAVERLVGTEIRDNPLLDSLYKWNRGGPGPDFIGRGHLQGQIYDITTPGQVPAHLARPYGQGLNTILYERPAGFP